MSGWWQRIKQLGQEVWTQGKDFLNASAHALQSYTERREHVEQLVRMPLPQLQQELVRAIPLMPEEDFRLFMRFLQDMILELFPQRFILPTDPDRALSILAQESDQLSRPQRVRATRLGTLMLMAWVIRSQSR